MSDLLDYATEKLKRDVLELKNKMQQIELLLDATPDPFEALTEKQEEPTK